MRGVRTDQSDRPDWIDIGRHPQLEDRIRDLDFPYQSPREVEYQDSGNM